MTTPTSRPYDANLIAIALAVLVCFGCLLSVCAAPTLLAYALPDLGSQTGLADVIPMCAWARGGSVGLWWNSGVTPARAFSVASRYNAVCVAVPWTAALPDRGRPAVDVTP